MGSVTRRNIDNSLSHSWYCAECHAINDALFERFSRLTENDYLKQSHFFGERYENIYVARSKLPEIEVVINTVLQQAATILQQPVDELRVGFWFNVMQPGHTTTLHSHDDDDELLSCVYYLRAPENSGDLILHRGEQEQHISPQEGMFVFFSPQLPHEVSVHQGSGPRISIAFNVGPVSGVDKQAG